MDMSEWIKGLTQNMSFTLLGTSTQKEDNAFTYSPSTSIQTTTSTQTTYSPTTTTTSIIAPKKTTYYAPVMIYSSPFAQANPTLKEGAVSPVVSPVSTTTPYIVPTLTTNQAQTTAKSDLTQDETMKWILIGGAIILAYFYLSK